MEVNSTLSVFANNTTWSGRGTADVLGSYSATPEEGLLSLSTTILIVDVLHCGIQPLISLLGILGNSLCVVVILCQGLQQTTHIILLGLAVTDLLYVLLSLRSPVECFARRLDHDLAVDLGLISSTTLIMLDSELAALSRLYTCFIAVERFIVVRYPLKVSTLLTKARTLVVSALLWLLAFLSCLPCFFLFEIGETYSPVHNASVKFLTPTLFLTQNMVMLNVMSSFVSPLLNRYIPLLLVFACTVFILRSLRQSTVVRQQMVGRSVGAKQEQRQQITKALLSVCVMYLITNIPGAVLSLCRLVYGKEGFGDVGRYQNTHKIALTVSSLFMVFNSSINFLLYVIFNQTFATISRKLVLCWKT